MTARKESKKPGTYKTAKLELSKETLRDLTGRHAVSGEVKGGVRKPEPSVALTCAEQGCE